MNVNANISTLNVRLFFRSCTYWLKIFPIAYFICSRRAWNILFKAGSDFSSPARRRRRSIYPERRERKVYINIHLFTHNWWWRNPALFYHSLVALTKNDCNHKMRERERRGEKVLYLVAYTHIWNRDNKNRSIKAVKNWWIKAPVLARTLNASSESTHEKYPAQKKIQFNSSLSAAVSVSCQFIFHESTELTFVLRQWKHIWCIKYIERKIGLMPHP